MFDLPDFSDDPKLTPYRVKDTIGKIVWSYSRRGTLQQCSRRYYYTYYATKLKIHDDKSSIKLLSRLQNRYECTGQILHLVISTFFRKAHDGDIFSTRNLCSWAENMFNSNCKRSKDNINDIKNEITKSNQPAYLQEFYYEEPDAEEKCESAMKRLLLAINEFAENQIFEVLRNAGMANDSLIEYPIRLSDFPCKVSGRMDFAYKDIDEVTVCDWKMGGSQGGDDSLQLTTYGMWAMSYFSVPHDKVHILKALLADGGLSSSAVNEKMLLRARARIIQDAEQMAALDYYGRSGMIEAFTPCAQKAVCSLCRFRAICVEGRECIDA